MTVALDAEAGDMTAACGIRWELVERRCRELGAETDDQRAELLGVSRRTILRYKKGDGARLSVVARIAQVIGVRLDQLVDDGTTPSPPPPQPPRPSGPPGRETDS